MTRETQDPWRATLARIGDYYAQLVAKHGSAPRSCDYGRAASQRRKFAAVAAVMPLQGCRVLDVGCGLGDFADYLDEHAENAAYVGVDIAPSMLEMARKLRPHLDLRLCDILSETPGTRFDLVTANGIFYLLGPNAQASMEKLIARMFELTDQAVAFTSLSTWAEKNDPDEFYADPLRTLEYCRTISPWVTLRHDYLQHDFTIYMYKQSPFADMESAT
jgi:cyclopropane fatty-acyl-phospholipid synthase-like methyltransferase